MSPSAPQRSIGLDLMRAACVAGVLATHFASFFLAANGPSGWIRQALSVGSFGVTGFFLLSAYLLTGILLREVAAGHRQIWKRYWIRRSLRIWPLYFIVLMACSIGVLAIGGQASGLPWLATFTYNWVSWSEPNTLLSHFWSMCAEEQLYILVPILSFVAFRWRWPSLMALVVVAPLARWWASDLLPYPAVWNFTTSHLDVFAIGVLLASLDHRSNESWRRIRSALATRGWVAAIVVTCAMGLVVLTALDSAWVFGSGAASWTYLVVALVWGWVLLRLSHRSWAAEAYPVRVGVWVGRRSYGIYVYHWPIVVIGTWLGSFVPIPAPVIGVVLFAVVLLVSEASFRWIESPFLRLKSRFNQDTATPVGDYRA